MRSVKSFYLVVVCALAVGCGVPQSVAHEEQQPLEMTNPILGKGADPWVLQHQDAYYYTHTTGSQLVLMKTHQMHELSQAESLTIWRPPAGKEYSSHIWAPELHYLDGKWYMYFAATYDNGKEHGVNENRRMFVLENSSQDPMNTRWSFKGKLEAEPDNWAIDGTVMEHQGLRYFIWSGWRGKDHRSNTGVQQLYIAKMTNPWTLEGERVLISEPTLDWERNGLVNEGPVIWKNPQGQVFLFYSASGCWTDDYKVGYMLLSEGADPMDPTSWIKHQEPVLQKSVKNSVYGPGHNSFFKSPDGSQDWILYHANDAEGQGCGGHRKPRIQRVYWDEQGRPVIKEPLPAGAPFKAPAGAKTHGKR